MMCAYFQAGRAHSCADADGAGRSSDGTPRDLELGPPPPQPAESITSHSYDCSTLSHEMQGSPLSARSPEDLSGKNFSTEEDVILGTPASQHSSAGSEPREATLEVTSHDLAAQTTEVPSWISKSGTNGHNGISIAELPQAQQVRCHIAATTDMCSSPSKYNSGGAETAESESQNCTGEGNASEAELEPEESAQAPGESWHDEAYVLMSTRRLRVFSLQHKDNN
jgi:hypothetical protein